MATLAVPTPAPHQLDHGSTLPLPLPLLPAVGTTFHPSNHIVVALVRWSRPPLGWCKLNFDGSVKHDGSGRASIGGVIRSCNGNAMLAYVERTAHANIGVEEARALLFGLHLALAAGYSSLVVEGDDLTLVKLLCRDQEPAHTHIPRTMYEEIMRLLGCFQIAVVQHVYREGNHVADALCHEAYRCPNVWTMDRPLPPAVWAKLEYDRRGT